MIGFELFLTVLEACLLTPTLQILLALSTALAFYQGFEHGLLLCLVCLSRQFRLRIDLNLWCAALRILIHVLHVIFGSVHRATIYTR